MEQCLIFATKNEGKMKEIREILSDVPYKVQSMSEAGIDIDVIEDGDTFEANALKKPLRFAKSASVLSWQMTPDLKSIISIKRQEFIRHDI